MSRPVALYAGSFDPYTNGHHDILRKAARLFDEVVVLIGVNVGKRRAFDAEAMAGAIQAAIDADGLNARVVIHTGLVAQYCAAHDIHWYVRGLRNGADYNYEENNAQVNGMINPGLETIYLRSDQPALSSSMVRELMAFGHPVEAYLPEPVGRLLRQGDGKREGNT